MSEERASKKVVMEKNTALATLLHTYFCNTVYVQEEITARSWVELYDEVWKITMDVDGAVNVRTFHTTLYDDICMAVKLQNASFRELLIHIPVLRPLYWHQYKALRLLRVFPHDIIWLILSHLKLLWIPNEKLVEQAALGCMRLCTSRSFSKKDNLWGLQLWNDMWQRANE